MHRRTGLGALAAAFAVAGCGFELRGAARLPFKSVALLGFEPRSPLALEFRRSLEPGVRVVDAPQPAEAVLQALTDRREKSVVASTAAGQVRDVQLRVKFGFRLAAASGRELMRVDELLLMRDMSYNETAALAKEQEEQQLYRAMESDIVSQVLRRLSALPAV